MKKSYEDSAVASLSEGRKISSGACGQEGIAVSRGGMPGSDLNYASEGAGGEEKRNRTFDGGIALTGAWDRRERGRGEGGFSASRVSSRMDGDRRPGQARLEEEHMEGKR